MIYQIFYDDNSLKAVQDSPASVMPVGVHEACRFPRVPEYVYDDEKYPNLTSHNTLCEWRVLYYIWNHYPDKWVGFTSWKHDRKGFAPAINRLGEQWALQNLAEKPISGFMVRPLQSVMIKDLDHRQEPTLKSQFIQWSLVEDLLQKKVHDTRSMPMGRYHRSIYWDFVMQGYRRVHGIDLEKELDWSSLGRIDFLHTWCNAFVAQWDYFDMYMRQFSPIVMSMLEYFGSHPVDLELSYICERLIILFNYIRYSDNAFFPAGHSTKHSEAARSVAHAQTGIAGSPNCDTISHRSAMPRNRYDISIITCSVDDTRFQGFQDNVADVFGPETQLIRIADPRSLAEGYNRGFRYSESETLIFCHDDIRFLVPESKAIIQQDLETNDIVGVAGTTKLVTGQWHSAGQPYTHGQVIHSGYASGKPIYQLCVFALDKEAAVIQQIHALDGLFLALNRNVMDHVQFDEQLFDGFHLYDLDFTYAAYLKGFKLAVDYRLQLLHHSTGTFDRQWRRYADLFHQKYAGSLGRRAPDASMKLRQMTSETIEPLIKTMSSTYHSSHFNGSILFQC